MKKIFGKMERRSKGFTLIELMVAIFIFSVILVGMVALFVSAMNSYTKSRAIKNVSENVQFALNSIAKDVRMGKVAIGTGDGGSEDLTIYNLQNESYVCYRFDTVTGKIQTARVAYEDRFSCMCGDPNTYNDTATCGGKTLVDLSGTGMRIGENSKFYAVMTDESIFQRGAVEINFEIKPEDPSTIGTQSDEVNIQTTVSTRDYGWVLPEFF